ncbi:acyl-CoA dehydrogenase family protein [Sphingomonas japonica]|uniref:Alkylation response protein AidB-like acyl-CoA dehydrogenase n=1 Tax=Sphingomonas japonica TaxID=511662 RepID=A0ABX0U3H9_9SPHN|nr:acyl-CoA dehydrogenase family protein [Sphingomonas japonica]NIJ23327.1 alkylation response protein AidB-like acyl-CoA dehydrogenase [Sphingomonas japonica]
MHFPEPDYLADAELRMFRDSVATFLDRAVDAERVAKWRADGQVERAFWHEAGQAGLLGVSVPEHYGGGGGDFRHDLVVVDQVQRKGIEGFAASLHNVIITPYIQLHGTEEQKARWLPGLANGDRVAAIAMSEPGAGSDLQAIRTTALKDGNGYRINGSKTFISNGQLADLIVVVAKTDPAQGARGTSLLIVETDDAEGFRRGRMLDKIGNEAQDTSELFFDDVWVPAQNLLGEAEGQGFRQLMAELPRERLLIAINSVAAMERALELTVEYTRERSAFGQPIFEFQNTQFTLADLYAKARVAACFVNDCINQAIAGTLDNPTSAIAKLFATETEGQVVDACLQLHGGYGYINDYPIARMFRNSRVSRIYGGSSEIMKLLIARAL